MTRADLRVAIKLPDSSLLPGTLLPAPRGRARVRLDAPGMSAALRPGIEMGLVAEDEGTVRIWRTTVLSVDGNEVVLQVKSAAAEEEAVEGALARVEGPAAFRHGYRRRAAAWEIWRLGSGCPRTCRFRAAWKCASR